MPPSVDFAKLYTLAQIRAIESAALASLPPGTLMQRAGNAAARLALEMYPDLDDVLVLAGPGNNGGDALDLAHRLDRDGLQVTVLLFADLATQPEDARQALLRAQSGKVRFPDAQDWPRILSARWSLVIDGLFGIGMKRPVGDPLKALIRQLNAFQLPVLALDVPSGLDADTGNPVRDAADQGANGGRDDGAVVVRADHTITFIGNKPGLHTGHGRDYAGQVHMSSLDTDAALFPLATAELNRVELFSESLRPRPQNSHKGSYGDVTIAGGAQGMGGAAILAARAAAKCGAGRVFIAFLDKPLPYDPLQPELMFRDADNYDFSTGTVVAGPGLGQSSAALKLLTGRLALDRPLVLDADALNLIAGHPGLQTELAQRTHPAIVTPHPLEAARLLGTSVQAIQADRLSSAREIADRFKVIVVLKGSGTVIARPDGKTVINPTGNPALATAGTGDVLAGICGALLGQGWDTWQAALAAPWLHGQAADILVKQGVGPVGMTASELIPCVRRALNEMIDEYGRLRRVR